MLTVCAFIWHGCKENHLGALPPNRGAASAPSGGWIWSRVSPPQPTIGSGERRNLPQRVRGGAPAGNAFWRISKATSERSFRIYADALSSSSMCFVSHLGARRRLGRATDRCPDVEPRPAFTNLDSIIFWQSFHSLSCRLTACYDSTLWLCKPT